MATNPNTFTLTPGMAPAAPLMRLLARFDRDKVEAFAEISVALLDLMDGEPDAEDDDPAEATGDEQDAAYLEWTTMRGSQKLGSCLLAGQEDDEEDDASGQYDEDCYTGPLPRGGWPGCPISDPGGDEHDGREPEDGY